MVLLRITIGFRIKSKLSIIYKSCCLKLNFLLFIKALSKTTKTMLPCENNYECKYFLKPLKKLKSQDTKAKNILGQVVLNSLKLLLFSWC